jgi:hypothetical protein
MRIQILIRILIQDSQINADPCGSGSKRPKHLFKENIRRFQLVKHLLPDAATILSISVSTLFEKNMTGPGCDLIALEESEVVIAKNV